MYDNRLNNVDLDIHAAILAHHAKEMMVTENMAMAHAAYHSLYHAYELMVRSHDKITIDLEMANEKIEELNNRLPSQ